LGARFKLGFLADYPALIPMFSSLFTPLNGPLQQKTECSIESTNFKLVPLCYVKHPFSGFLSVLLASRIKTRTAFSAVALTGSRNSYGLVEQGGRLNIRRGTRFIADVSCDKKKRPICLMCAFTTALNAVFRRIATALFVLTWLLSEGL
jgi:hypothetical protein